MLDHTGCYTENGLQGAAGELAGSCCRLPGRDNGLGSGREGREMGWVREWEAGLEELEKKDEIIIGSWDCHLSS